ncbi:MAG: hypothetical protein R3C09_25210 [Pirellulaceae bacterium]
MVAPVAPAVGVYLGRTGYVYGSQYGTAATGLAVELANPAPIAIGMAGAGIARVAPVEDWSNLLGGVRIRQSGNYWIKEVNPYANSIAQWWGRGALNAQAKALEKLGTMAPSYLYRNGKLVTRDVGRFQGSSSEAWSIWAQGSVRLRTPFNDIRSYNIGANGQIFDPALHPIHAGIYWGGAGVTTGLFGAWGCYELQSR